MQRWAEGSQAAHSGPLLGPLQRGARRAGTPTPRLAPSALRAACACPHSSCLQGAALSAMQVQDRDGRWQCLELGPHEVAVLAGAALQHATAGLLRAAPHRVVGQPFGPAAGGAGAATATGRRALAFELRPRPEAVLDLTAQLAAAGHVLPARCGWLVERGPACRSGGWRWPCVRQLLARRPAAACRLPGLQRWLGAHLLARITTQYLRYTLACRYAPVSMSSLAEQFEGLLSPAAKVATPEQQQGAAAHVAWAAALQTGAAQKRCVVQGDSKQGARQEHCSAAGHGAAGGRLHSADLCTRSARC